MIPMLFDAYETEFSKTIYPGRTGIPGYKTGIVQFIDCISCIVNETLNGEYNLTMKIPKDGQGGKDVQIGMLILCKPNARDLNQAFRIYKMEEDIDGILTIYANHVCYDLAGYPVEPFSLTGSVTIKNAINNLISHCIVPPSQFEIITDKTTTVNAFSVSELSSLKSWFIGRQGSLVDVFTGEWSYDNYTCRLMSKRGVDTGFKIIDDKNLMTYSNELTSENFYTDIIAVYKYTDSDTDTEVVVKSDLINLGIKGYSKVFILDANTHFNENVPTVTELNSYAEFYAETNKINTYLSTTNVGFIVMKNIDLPVGIGDTVSVITHGKNIDARIRQVCWDVIDERYTTLTVGDLKETITQTIKKIK